MSADPSRAEAQKLCTFLVDGLLFGVEVKHVQEVLRPQEMTPVPLANEAVRGLINLRGQIVTALDVRRRLGLRDKGGGEPPMNVVVRTGDGVVSLLVDEIGEVVEVEADRFEATPETVAPGLKALLEGVCKLSQQLLLVLDPRRAAEIELDGARRKD